MTDRELSGGLSAALHALLSEAALAPDGILSLTDDPRGEEVVALAERLTDLGLFRIVTARRYRLSDAGKAALEPRGRRSRPQPAPAAPGEGDAAEPKGFWKRLFGGKS
ncbi:hypothetical protein [Pseudogemmobacter bohemicus]|uniref:hypothetical protein n=1 Tax=Pseudogemmobacter bohemicus TaxID=2250708 RepID=UPI000DD3B1E2|nr:hypothetical protein [Pseudogemmobacter bohemicus]